MPTALRAAIASAAPSSSSTRSTEPTCPRSRMMVPSRSSRMPGRRLFVPLTSAPPQLLHVARSTHFRRGPEEGHKPGRDHLRVVVAPEPLEGGSSGSPELLLGLEEVDQDL